MGCHGIREEAAGAAEESHGNRKGQGGEAGRRGATGGRPDREIRLFT